MNFCNEMIKYRLVKNNEIPNKYQLKNNKNKRNYLFIYLFFRTRLIFWNAIALEPELRFLSNKKYLKAKRTLYVDIYKAKMVEFNLFKVYSYLKISQIFKTVTGNQTQLVCLIIIIVYAMFLISIY